MYFLINKSLKSRKKCTLILFLHILTQKLHWKSAGINKESNSTVDHCGSPFTVKALVTKTWCTNCVQYLFTCNPIMINVLSLTLFFFLNKISDLSEEQIVCYLWGLILYAKCILLPPLLMIEIRLRKNENLLSFWNNLSTNRYVLFIISSARKVMKCLFRAST